MGSLGIRRRGGMLALAVVLLTAGSASFAVADRGFSLSQIEAALEAITDDLGIAEDGDIGTLDDSDEKPAFGNAVFRRVFADRSVRHVGGLTDRPPGDDVAVFHIVAVWGRIKPNDDTRWTPLRWDPALSVAPGDGVRVRRELRFERGDRVHPQRVRHEVLMSSVTGAGVDGVVSQVAITASDAESAYFRFHSKPISVEIPLRDLAELNEFHSIDRTGNGLMLVAVQRPPQSDPCAHGFMGGRWARTSDQGGVFGGIWRTAQGERSGHLAGRWGVTEDGAQVFHGKVVNAQGEFLAFMSGNYGDGEYHGELLGRGDVLLGTVRGHYTNSDDEGHGLFRGAWQQDCPTASCPCDFTSAVLAAKRNARRLGVEFPRLECRTCLGLDHPDGDIAILGQNPDVELSAVPACDTASGRCCTERHDIENEDGDVSEKLEVRGTGEEEHDACLAELHRVARSLGIECIPVEPPLIR